MNKKQFLVIGLIVVALAGIFWWMINRSVNLPAPLPISNNSTSTNRTINITTITSTTPIATSTLSSTSTIPLWGQYDINFPDGFILVDSQGRRSGGDPITGTIYREIPNTGGYGEAGNPGHNVNELGFSTLSKGEYTLYVIGGQTGVYSVEIANSGGLRQPLSGMIQKGSMAVYLQNYNPANLASSTFSFEGTASSTASITTAPPNNWIAP